MRLFLVVDQIKTWRRILLFPAGWRFGEKKYNILYIFTLKSPFTPTTPFNLILYQQSRIYCNFVKIDTFSTFRTFWLRTFKTNKYIFSQLVVQIFKLDLFCFVKYISSGCLCAVKCLDSCIFIIKWAVCSHCLKWILLYAS